MTPKVKLALENLKLRLRKAGLARSAASEAAILEVLILHADFDVLLTSSGDNSGITPYKASHNRDGSSRSPSLRRATRSGMA